MNHGIIFLNLILKGFDAMCGYNRPTGANFLFIIWSNYFPTTLNPCNDTNLSLFQYIIIPMQDI